MMEYGGYNNKLFWPLVFVFVGTAILMMNMGILPSGLARLWPVALVILGLIGLTSGYSGIKTTKTKKPRRK
jgi:hypothetical protein